MPSGKLKVKASTFEALKAKMTQAKKEKKDLGEFVLNVSDVVESGMLTYADVCGRMLTYTDVC